MPLDSTTRRFAVQLQGELRELDERSEEHRARGEALKLDSVTRIATWETRLGDVTARHYGEVLATYAPRDRILRWAWVGRSEAATPTHAEVIVHGAEARGVPQLSMSLVADLDREAAETLARLGAVVAGAEGFVVRAVGSELHFVGLFDRPTPDAAARYSVPPPPIGGATRAAPSTPPGPSPPSSASAPARATAGTAHLREPSRAHFVPVANAAMTALARACPRYRQGLLVVTVAPPLRGDGVRRVVVQLVALDEAGALRALDAPRDLVDAATEMTDAGRRDGHAVWRKLSARILPKPDGGATLHVDVV